MKYRMNLQLFGEGGDGGAPGAAGGEAEAAVSQVAAGKKTSSNPLANVQYGIQEGEKAESGTAQVITFEETTPDRKSEFEKLIKGEYKEQYDERVQALLNKRFKTQGVLEERQRQMAPIMDILAQKYGVDTTDGIDYEKLRQAIYDDDAYYEEEALQKGIPVSALKEMKRMERENTEFKQAMAEREREDANHKAYETLLRQSDEVKKLYPGFDLATEMDNQNFARLIAANVDARTAYEVVHRDEIQPAMAQYVAQRTAQKIAQNIQSGTNRPTENGAAASGGIVAKTDVSKLTKDDRAEIMRRVARGEKIRF